MYNCIYFKTYGYKVTIFTAQLVEALRYKPEGRRFDFRRCHGKFSLAYFFRPRYGLGVDLVSNRNELPGIFPGDKAGRCVGLTTLPPSCPDCLEIWEPQTLGKLRACLWIVLHILFNDKQCLTIT
jgi:hypothetical protein